MAEPGRGLVADAGVLVSEVILVSRKSATDAHRWVYLDCGLFRGLIETFGEAIRYRIETDRDGDSGALQSSPVRPVTVRIFSMSGRPTNSRSVYATTTECACLARELTLTLAQPLDLRL